MRKFGFGFPGVNENFQACREMAAQARVELIYFVTSPTSASNDTLHVTRSLPTAFELWKSEPDRRLSVTFKWSIGDESGAGSIRFDHENTSTSQRFTERSVAEVIVQDITHRLFERIPQLESV